MRPLPGHGGCCHGHPRRPHVPSPAFPSDAAALNGALIVLAAIAAVLIRAEERVPRDDRRLAAATLRDQVIVWADGDRRRMTLPNPFPAAVEAALDAAPWWQQLQTTLISADRGRACARAGGVAG